MLDDLSEWASSVSTPSLLPEAEVEISGDVPSWLGNLFREEFFDPCSKHLGFKQNEKNIFCLDCCMSFCSNCASTHISHRALQIRKYNDHRVVKTEDMEKIINCSLVQSYMLNRALVVFLKERTQNRLKEKAQAHAQPSKKKGPARKGYYQNSDKVCASCPRPLKEEYEYCSITCMVKQVLKTEGSILGHLRECKFLPLPWYLEDDQGQVPNEPNLGEPTGSRSIMIGARRVGCLKRKKKNNEEASLCRVVSLHRRKGIPRRSPLF